LQRRPELRDSGLRPERNASQQANSNPTESAENWRGYGGLAIFLNEAFIQFGIFRR
jgi:hypothetical protein